MGTKNDQGDSDSRGVVKTRKPYDSPTIERFGPVSYLTQGSTGDKGDGGGSKRTDNDKGKGKEE